MNNDEKDILVSALLRMLLDNGLIQNPKDNIYELSLRLITCNSQFPDSKTVLELKLI